MTHEWSHTISFHSVPMTHQGSLKIADGVTLPLHSLRMTH